MTAALVLSPFLLSVPSIAAPIAHADDVEELLRENKTEQKHFVFDIRPYLHLRENDWRDEHPSNRIIWSHESKHHPDFGKFVARVGENHRTDRVSHSSRMMSFVILGSVIGFILYTYLSHVIIARRMRRELERSRLRALLHSSAMIMASSVHQMGHISPSGRRRSILNMFRGFRL